MLARFTCCAARDFTTILVIALIAAGCERAESHEGDDADDVQAAGLELENLEKVEEVFIHAAADNWCVPADELDREVVVGTPTTVRDVWIRAVVHLHEHLGQSIAYARSNGVVPPWNG